MKGLKLIREMTCAEMIEEITEFQRERLSEVDEAHLRMMLAGQRADSYRARQFAEAGLEHDGHGNYFVPNCDS